MILHNDTQQMCTTQKVPQWCRTMKCPGHDLIGLSPGKRCRKRSQLAAVRCHRAIVPYGSIWFHRAIKGRRVEHQISHPKRRSEWSTTDLIRFILSCLGCLSLPTAQRFLDSVTDTVWDARAFILAPHVHPLDRLVRAAAD